MKWTLALAFTVVCVAYMLVLGFHPTLGPLVAWPWMLVGWLFDVDLNSPQYDMVIIPGTVVGWALAGFVVGAWLDGRAHRRALMKKHLRD